MTGKSADPHEAKQKFWKALADSPFVFLELQSDGAGPVPMTAQLDKEANSAIWFFTSRQHHLAKGGPAQATFAAKDHHLFASFQGRLTQETSRERLEKEWSRAVEAWFPEGKDDPDLLMLRMDLGDAEIWQADFGLIESAKIVLGKDLRDAAKGKHAETTL